MQSKPGGTGAPNPGGDRRTTSARSSSAHTGSQIAAVSGLPFTNTTVMGLSSHTCCPTRKFDRFRIVPERRTQEQRRIQARTRTAARGRRTGGGGRGARGDLGRRRRAGRVHRGTVTHHFGSKQALLDALAKSSQSGFVPGLGALPPGSERLMRHIEGYIGQLDGMAGRAFCCCGRIRDHARTCRDLPRPRRGVSRRSQGGCRGGHPRRHDPADVEPADVAVMVLGQLRGIAMQRLLDPVAVNL